MEDVITKVIGEVHLEKDLGNEVEISVYDPMYVETNNKGGLDISLVNFRLKSDQPYYVKMKITATESSYRMEDRTILTFGDNQVDVMILPEDQKEGFQFTDKGFRFARHLEFGEDNILGADSASYVVQAHSKDVNLDTYQHFSTGADGIYGGYREMKMFGETQGIYLSVGISDDMMDNLEFIDIWKYIFGIK